MKTNTPIFTLISSGPGELTNWVAPICHALKEDHKDAIIDIMLTPCQFASGLEHIMAKDLPLVRTVSRPKETFKLGLKGHLGKRHLSKERHIVLFLGGDPFYANGIGKYLNAPVYGYAEKEFKTKFKKLFTRDQIGDLMASKIAYNLESKDLTPPTEDPYFLFLAGSRKEHYHNILPIYQKTIRYIKTQDTSFKAILLCSPFLKGAALDAFKATYDLSQFDSLSQNTEAAMTHASGLITIPGTNTAEAAYLQTPMIVMVALNKPSVITLKGLAHFISKIPIIGYLLRLLIIAVLLLKKPLLALPNILLNERFIQERIGYFSGKHLGTIILEFETNPKEKKMIKKKLEAFKPDKTPAKILIQKILKLEQL